MGCFCHATLVLPLPQLNVSASLAMPGANVAMGLSAWLSARGLPSVPWSPEPAWLSLPLPSLRLSAQAVATISALASLRAQVLAQFGLDLLIPAQARAFARIVATLNARLALMANLNADAWIQLGLLNAAIDQIQLALAAGLLPPGPGLLVSLTLPGGIPMARWMDFLALLRLLAPMIAAATQLGVSLAATAEFSAALRVLARLSLPALTAPQLMASLTAALSAVASLQASLGISPLALGLPGVQLRVQAKLNLLLPTLAASFGLNLGGVGLPNLLAALLALLPPLPPVPSFAASAVVQASLQAQAMASLNWQVPAMLPSIQIGLPVCAFAAQLQAALGLQAVASVPCAACDARAIMGALAAA
jgi:hypothetical protein